MKKNNIINSNIGDYTIHKEIGQGGNGNVYCCINNNTSEKCAIKYCYKNDYVAFRRFWDEIYIVKLLQSKNIPVVPIVETNVQDQWEDFKNDFDSREQNKLQTSNYYYYISKKASPLTSNFLNQNIESKVQYIFQLFELLCNLHKEGIYHRDIKWDNLLMYNQNLVLGDYGLVNYPNKESVTLKREAIGGVSAFDPISCGVRKKYTSMKWLFDVCEFAKVIWYILRGENDNKSIFGQYNPRIKEWNLFYFLTNYETSKLNELLLLCTDIENPMKRPKMAEFYNLFKKWWEDNQDDIKRINGIWNDILNEITPNYKQINSIEWILTDEIQRIRTILSNRIELNIFNISPNVISINDLIIDKIRLSNNNRHYCIELSGNKTTYTIESIQSDNKVTNK